MSAIPVVNHVETSIKAHNCIQTSFTYTPKVRAAMNHKTDLQAQLFEEILVFWL